ncbi:hypothetical protein RRG08_064400 [Elysia crispata]|uniref:Uncharacterized protein n=1 Tax=Elysia crispata TaxID=231223 RepID=A0AAE1AS29_9GAST|nr:hypothetical protein RRG08_064400 [Elysia crispata]
MCVALSIGHPSAAPMPGTSSAAPSPKSHLSPLRPDLSSAIPSSGTSADHSTGPSSPLSLLAHQHLLQPPVSNLSAI